MTEGQAIEWLTTNVSRETLVRLRKFVAFLSQEQAAQNLIAKSTMDHVWARHIVDSAQLLSLAPYTGEWLDLGSGPGLPGLVVAATGRATTLVESRTRRVQFLQAASKEMGIHHSTMIIGTRLERAASTPFSTISARAFAPLERLLPLAWRFSTPETVWVLPKGRSAAGELEAVAASWQGDFRMVPSITDPEASIIVARDVRPRKRR